MLLTEKLIQLVKDYPILYDLSHVEYKNLRKKDKLWRKLGLEMNQHGDQLKKRWKNLRDTYAKHLKSSQKSPGKNKKKNYKNWQWAKEMEHFRPFMPISNVEEPSQEIDNCDETFIKSEFTENAACCDMLSEISVENIKTDEDFEDSPWDSQLNTACIPNTSKSPSPRIFDNPTSSQIAAKKKITNMPTQTVTNSNRVSDYLHNDRIAELDPIELILLGYAKTIKAFSPQRQAITKLKFAQIMMEQECKHHEELS